MSSRWISGHLFFATFVPAVLLAASYPLFFKAVVPPSRIKAHHSLASLSGKARSDVDEVYPEDVYSGGAYINLPFGRVRLVQRLERRLFSSMGFLFRPCGTKYRAKWIPRIVIWRVASERVDLILLTWQVDLYGRGYSDAPSTQYDINLYTTQLALLMQHVRWEKSNIVGYSMGGAIVAAFTDQFPELVDEKVVLIASAGILQANDLPLRRALLTSPVTRYIVTTGYMKGIRQRELTTPSLNPLDRILKLQHAYLPYFSIALLLSLRDGPLSNQAQSFNSEAFNGRKVLIIHGTDDKTIPFRYASEIKDLFPEGAHAKLVGVPGADHDLAFTHSDVVVQEIMRFIELGL